MPLAAAALRGVDETLPARALGRAGRAADSHAAAPRPTGPSRSARSTSSRSSCFTRPRRCTAVWDREVQWHAALDQDGRMDCSYCSRSTRPRPADADDEARDRRRGAARRRGQHALYGGRVAQLGNKKGAFRSDPRDIRAVDSLGLRSAARSAWSSGAARQLMRRASRVQSQPRHEPRALPEGHDANLRGPAADHRQRARRGHQRVLRRDPRTGRKTPIASRCCTLDAARTPRAGLSTRSSRSTARRSAAWRRRPRRMGRMIATARIVLPADGGSAGRLSVLRVGQAMMFMAGANSIFNGDKLLTTANSRALADRCSSKARPPGKPAHQPPSPAGRVPVAAADDALRNARVAAWTYGSPRRTAGVSRGVRGGGRAPRRSAPRYRWRASPRAAGMCVDDADHADVAGIRWAKDGRRWVRRDRDLRGETRRVRDVPASRGRRWPISADDAGGILSRHSRGMST